MASQINIVHSIASLALKHGGPSYTVCALASAQQALTSGSVHIVAGHLQPDKDVLPDSAVNVHGINRAWPGSLISTRAKLATLLSPGNAVLHDQGIWHPQNLAVSGYAAQRNLPYVISTHGMLEPWTLRYHPLRKKLARWLYQDNLLRTARCLMATSFAELASIRAAGLNNPVAVIANGIDANIPVSDRSSARTHKTLLFLSRIHPVKGLIHLIEAWQALRPPDWRLLIVGPDENNHRQELQMLVDQFGLQAQVQFRNAVTGTDKYQCYRDADAFVLPSYSENFGVAVAEALACGLPVITTTGTPWNDLASHRCGWYINTGTEALVAALREVFSTSQDMLCDMGQRGRQWMLSDFQWPLIAAQNLAVYEWLLGFRDMPSCVDITARSHLRQRAAAQTNQHKQQHSIK